MAAGLVFGASAAVLVLEILAVRMLAPYVGLTIETYTAIIGVVLAGIALGSALGGRLADLVAPRQLLGPLLVVGGLLAMASVPLIEWASDAGAGTSDGTLVLAVLALLPPAAVLSAVTPTTAKLQLLDLATTGAVVGRLSAWATGGALVGTFTAGFVLVPLLPTRTSVLVVGGSVAAAGLLLSARLGSGRARWAAVAGGVALALAVVGVAAGSPCQAETTYHCARIAKDPERSGGRVLLLDDLRHSYVDLDDPEHLEFSYVRWIAAAVDATVPVPAPLDAVFIGGGALTLPRYLQATRPASRSRVLEIDERLVQFVDHRLDLPRRGVKLVLGDARVGMRQLARGSADVVVGDAFSGRAVPWHLSTRQFAAQVRRVLRPGGLYAANVIDQGSLRLARAVAATLRRVFDHVALVADRTGRGEPAGGNLVLLASDDPLPLQAVAAEVASRDGPSAAVFDERAVASFADPAAVLTDDFAPADQLLTAGR